MARPSKLTPETQDIIVKAIQAGMPQAHAARLAGINESTFYRWKSTAEASKDGKYKEFCEALKKSESQGMMRSLAIIQKAAQGGDVSTDEVKTYDGHGNVIETKITKKTLHPNWTASAWILERRHPTEFARKDKLGIDIENVDERIARGLERLASIGKARDGRTDRATDSD